MALGIGDLVANLRMNTAGFTRGAKMAKLSMRGLGSAVASQAALIATAMAAASAAVAIAAGRSSESFNQAMNSSLAIMKDVNAEMRADMQKTAFDIARSTKFSGKEAAESYFFLASAGLDAAQSLQALPVVAKFAQAGMFDMAKATELLTDAQSALGKSFRDPTKNMKEMTRLGDILVKANTLANASVEQFSEALTNKAAAAMRFSNIATEEGVAVLAAFADQGLKGSEAGTAFAIVLRDMQTKSIENKEAFKALGIEVFDSTGKFRNMADIVGDMEVALFGLSDEQKKATLLQLGFSDRSVAFQQTLLGTSQKIREYEEELRKAGGTMKDVSDSQLTPFRKGMEALKATFAEFSVDQMTGPMAELGEAMQDLAKKGGALEGFLDGFIDQSGDIVNAFNSVADALTDATLAFLQGQAVLLGDTMNAESIAAQRRELGREDRPTSVQLTPEEQRAHEQAQIFKEAQERAILAQRRGSQFIRQLDAQAANQQRAKDMELLKENQKAADKVREAFSNPLQDYLDKLKDLEKLRGAPGGLTDAEFRRASSMARREALDAIEKDKLPEFLKAEEKAVEEAVTPTAGRIAEFGTDAAFQAILAATRDEDAAKRTAENTKKAAEALENIDQNIAAVEAVDILG